MKKGLFVLFLLCVLSGFLQAQEIRLPNAMASLGDSISEAILSDFSFENGLPTSEMWRMVGLGTIADKQKRIEAFRSNYAAKGKVWSTGFDEESFVYSHYQRLLELNPKIIAANFAVAGSESKQLNLQVNRLIQFENEHEVHFDYITLLIGANDLKQDRIEEIPPAIQFIANIENQLRRVLETRVGQTWILLVGLPDIFKIFDKTNHLVVKSILGQAFTCYSLRKTIYGDSPLFESQDSKFRSSISQIFHQYHDGLHGMAERLQRDFSNVKIKVVDRYETSQTAVKSISIDCFHPSEFGQAEIAEITWRRGFWSHGYPKFSLNWP